MAAGPQPTDFAAQVAIVTPRVFVGLGEGWASPAGSTPTAEDIAARLGEITAPDPYSIPTSIYDEVAQLIDRFEITL